MSLVNIINELVVTNMQEAIKFYKQNLGFEIELTEEDSEPYTWVQMKNGDIKIMLEDYKTVCKEIEDFPKKTISTNLVKFKYDNEKEIIDLYNKLKENQVSFFMDLKKTEYGMIEYGILDSDENRN